MEQKKQEKPWKEKTIKTVRNIACLLMIAVAVEILVFNFRSFQSLFYQETSYKEYEYAAEGMTAYENDVYSLQEEGEHVLQIDHIDQEVKNVRIDIEVLNSIPLFYLENDVCKVDLNVCDEGNAIPYRVTSRSILYHNEASKYAWIQLYGDMKSLRLDLSLENGYLIQIHDIVFNAKRPLLFSWIRCALIFSVLLAGYGLRKNSALWRADCLKLQGWQKGVAAALGIGIFGLFWFLITKNDLVTYGNYYAHYRELARALDSGRTYVSEAPPEALLSMENPYDTALRLELVGDGMWDYAYFDGKYYVYYGILPCLLFYWPMYHFLGLDLPNTVPIMLCSMMFALGLFLLFREIIKQYFKKTPFAVLLLLTAAGIFGCQIPEFINNPSIYAVPIVMAITLTVWGLYLWVASAEDAEKIHAGKLLAGSVCMACVAGCRPNLVIYSLLALPVFWRYLKKRHVIKNLVLLLLPYVVVAAGLMYYNAIRFGSVFDFGNAYNLTSVDLTHNFFSLDKVVLAVNYYLFRLPRFNWRFPFFLHTANEANSFRHCAVYIEQVYAGLLIANPVLWTIFAFCSKKFRIQNSRLKMFCGVSLICAVCSMLLTAQLGGISFRYMADFSPICFLVAAIMVCMVLEKTEDKEYAPAVRRFVVIACIVSVLIHLNILFVPSEKFPLSDGNTELFYRIFYGFNFW